MPARRVLLLGGTREGRELARALVAEGFDVTTSLAGITTNPALPEGQVRRGSFGGARGLAAFITAGGFGAIADATHPFAAQMSRHAAEAGAIAAIPLLRLERPPWQPAEGDDWTNVASVAEAVSALPSGARVLLTIGRKEAARFFARADISGVARMIEPVPPPAGGLWRIVLERPPFSSAHDVELITHHAISHVVSKNAGGEDTVSKLTAARQLGLPVVMIARPEKPQVPVYDTVASAVTALSRALLP